jgi:hypothetical protein
MLWQNNQEIESNPDEVNNQIFDLRFENEEEGMARFKEYWETPPFSDQYNYFECYSWKRDDRIVQTSYSSRDMEGTKGRL